MTSSIPTEAVCSTLAADTLGDLLFFGVGIIIVLTTIAVDQWLAARAARRTNHYLRRHATHKDQS